MNPPTRTRRCPVMFFVVLQRGPLAAFRPGMTVSPVEGMTWEVVSPGP